MYNFYITYTNFAKTLYLRGPFDTEREASDAIAETKIMLLNVDSGTEGIVDICKYPKNLPIPSCVFTKLLDPQIPPQFAMFPTWADAIVCHYCEQNEETYVRHSWAYYGDISSFTHDTLLKITTVRGVYTLTQDQVYSIYTQMENCDAN